MRKHKFKRQQMREIKRRMSKENKRKIKDIKAYNRLLVLHMRMLGKSNKEISEVVGFSVQYITELVAKYIKEGMDAILTNKHTGNNRRMSFVEESAFLEQFLELGEAGQIITIHTILTKYEEATLKPCDSSTIYRLLKRHGWRKVKPRPEHPGKASEEEIESSKKKINKCYRQLVLEKNRRNKRNKGKKYRGVKIMFADEAGFGRISDPSNCWAPPKIRPVVPCQRVREYRTVYGAISPISGESFFMVLDKSNTDNMSLFMTELSKKFPDEMILLCMDNASWHKANALKIHTNIRRFYIPPRTPEMNPIEIVWREIRKLGFKNKAFQSIDAVVQKFYDVIENHITNEAITNITLWPWVEKAYCLSDANSRILKAA